MTFFNSRIVAAMAPAARSSAIANAYAGPIFWSANQLPFFCDIPGFLLPDTGGVVDQEVRRGLADRLGGDGDQLPRGRDVFFLGFTVASIAFDIVTRAVGYSNLFSRPYVGHGLRYSWRPHRPRSRASSSVHCS